MINNAFIIKYKSIFNINNDIFIVLGLNGSLIKNILTISKLYFNFSTRYEQNVLLSLSITSSNTKSSNSVSRYSSILILNSFFEYNSIWFPFTFFEESAFAFPLILIASDVFKEISLELFIILLEIVLFRKFLEPNEFVEFTLFFLLVFVFLDWFDISVLNPLYDFLSLFLFFSFYLYFYFFLHF